MRKTTQQRLSKSRFTAGLQCLKRLYLLVNEPDEAAEVSAASQVIFDQGSKVGSLATDMFKGGVLVDEDYLHSREATEKTKLLVDDKAIPAIFEAAFTYDNIHVRVDILERLPRNRWHLIEVKSTTKVKEHHKPDVAIQKYVLEQSGLKVSKASLMHLNTKYVYDGKKYQLRKLFTIADVTADIKALTKDLPGLIEEQRAVLMKKRPPKIEPGSQCRKPYTCDFYDLCNPAMPADWIGNLYNIREGKLEKLKALGISSIKKIPSDFKLSVVQNRMRECLKKKKAFFSDTLPKKLSELSPPIYFMDFETINPALPCHKGMRPYGLLTFQWSLHLKTGNGSKLKHFEFLHATEGDPRENFIKELLKTLDLHKDALIVVYNQKFESDRLEELAGYFPQYAKRIKRVQNRLWDLLPVVREHVYHPKFGGSFSIKNVLPALLPEMSYEGMGVAEGQEASAAFLQMIDADTGKSEKKQLYNDLLAYCRQDTLAMVKVVEVLRCKK